MMLLFIFFELYTASTINSAELKTKILYESFLDINSFLFIIQVNGFSENEVIDLTNKIVLSGRKYISNLPKKEILVTLKKAAYVNPKVSVPMSPSLKSLLERRNKYFEKDTSQIAKRLYLAHLDKLKKDTEELFSFKQNDNTSLLTILEVTDILQKDKKYFDIILSLRKSIIDDENLTKAINREKIAFYQEFGEELRVITPAVTKLKMQLSLGGAIFAPDVLVALTRRLLLTRKSEFVHQIASALLKPIELLELRIRHRSNIEKKEEILSFLNACLEKLPHPLQSEIDEAFKMRSKVMTIFFKGETEQNINDKMGLLDDYQEKYIKEMIDGIKELNNRLFNRFLIINKDVIKLYGDYLEAGYDKLEKQLIKSLQ
ncbi:hypothetical protein TCON_2123 [Astathelohania contejeani]|uniref:Uncharacterized protein n=1 Tax=Astathelohania contejeani TaxID=164912 RepID=A0ABQ7HWW6_9MICR|nr:hypothetical protein TCON_2123 [Thelohania contejeani]